MQPKSLLRFLLPVVVLAFLLGILSVLVFDSPGADISPTAPTGSYLVDTSASTSDPNNTTVLVLGIDNFTSRSPQLQAVWWVTFDVYSDQIRLFGLPTNALVETQARPVNEMLDLRQDGGPSAEFLSALNAFAPHYQDVVLVLDETAFAQLVDFMGGAMLDGEIFDGQTIVSSLNFIGDNPQMQLSMQASLLLSLSYQGARLGENPEITSLTALIPDHAYSSIPPTTLVNLLIPLLPLDPATIHIEVWQP